LPGQETIFSSLVVPRQRVLSICNQRNVDSVVAALEIHQKYGKDCGRGEKAHGISDCKAKQVVAGLNVCQGQRGHMFSKAWKANQKARSTTINWVKRLQHIVMQFMPTEWIRSLVRLHDENAWPTMGEGVLFTAACASSIDFAAKAHVDSDFLFSIHQTNVAGAEHLHMDAPVAQYFCFPNLGYAIAMRPADVIMFNSNVIHCLSSKTKAYQEHKVYATSFYTKTGHVSGNDNSKALSTEEMEYFELNLK
jgi:hypothetical protein